MVQVRCIWTDWTYDSGSRSSASGPGPGPGSRRSRTGLRTVYALWVSSNRNSGCVGVGGIGWVSWSMMGIGGINILYLVSVL